MDGFYLSAKTETQNLKKEVANKKLSNPGEFLDEISQLDPVLPQFNYQVSLFRNGMVPDWNQAPPDNEGGHFALIFSSNVQAFRSFCIISVDWLSGLILFGESIDGILVSIKKNYVYLQIWVKDGFSATHISQRYNYLLDWLQNTAGIKDPNTYQIEFHVHPKYRVYKTPKSAVMSMAAKIKSFQICIEGISNGSKGQKFEGTASFDLNVANMHKRPRKERRLRPSYVDTVDTSKM